MVRPLYLRSFLLTNMMKSAVYVTVLFQLFIVVLTKKEWSYVLILAKWHKGANFKVFSYHGICSRNFRRRTHDFRKFMATPFIWSLHLQILFVEELLKGNFYSNNLHIIGDLKANIGNTTAKITSGGFVR